MSGWQLDKREAWLAGVCAGLARHWRVNPLWVRIGTLIAGVFFTQLTLIAYVAAWAIVDSDR